MQRGDVTLWLSADARDAWRPLPSGRPAGQQRFTDLAIRTALTLRLVFRLPLRQAEGFVWSVLASMDVDLEAPDHTTLSRRSRHLDVGLRRIPAKGSIHLIVSSTGLSGSHHHQDKEDRPPSVADGGCYHRQARVENAFFRYKALIGSGLRARAPGGRVTEAVIACSIPSQVTELGRPASYATGR